MNAANQSGSINYYPSSYASQVGLLTPKASRALMHAPSCLCMHRSL
jgi:hypothetical protein